MSSVLLLISGIIAVNPKKEQSLNTPICILLSRERNLGADADTGDE